MIHENLSADIEEHISLIRKYTNIPISVGFGISKPEHVERIAKVADGIIVGSAIVKKIAAGGDTDNMINDVKNFVSSLVKPIK